MSEPRDDIEDELPDKLFFRIGEAAAIVGVEAHVLRYWETEFKLRPQRSDSGQRMYRRQDLGKLLRIKRLLHDQGFTIAGARKALSDPSDPAAKAPVAGEDDAGAPVDGGAFDGERLGELADRLDAVRRRVRAARARFAAVGIAPPRSNG